MTTTTDIVDIPAIDETILEEPVIRRSFLARARNFGAVVVGGIAATWADAPSALASPYCCDLAHPNGPWCGGTKEANFSSSACGSGYYKTEWLCCSNTWLIACEECSKGKSSCDDGPWKCSNFYFYEKDGC